MKAHHLLFENSIDINPRLGTIKLNDKRMALMSVEALGLLRRDLVSTLNKDRAKGFLLRFGWACGYNDAESIEKMYNWESKKELLLAGPALHTLEGVVTVEPDVLEFNENELYMSGYWRYSFEAEEHIRHFGYSNEAVCWMLVGYATGFLEKAFGKKVAVYEKSCIGKKDGYCYFIAQTAEHCTLEHRKILRYYQEESLATELDNMYSQMKSLTSSIIRSEEVHKQLTNLLLEGKNLQNLIEVISDVLGRSVVIEKGGLNKAFVSKFINKEDLVNYQNWRKNERSQLHEQIKTFKIIANKLTLGRLIIIGKESLNIEEQMIVERSLSVLSIHIYTQRTIAQSLWQKKIDFFEELLDEGCDTESLLHKANHIFDFDIEKNNRILVIKSIPKEKNEEIRFLLNSTYPNIDLFLKKGYLVMILQQGFEKEHQIKNFLSQVQTLIEKNVKHAKFYIGAGRVTSSVSDIGESYRDSFKICDFLSLAYPTKNIASYFEQLDPIMLFLKSMDPNELLIFCKKTLKKLIDYDHQNASNLIQTLKNYLDNNGSLNQTAKEMNLSIPGLRYRLEKIESLCDVDLKTGNGRFHCQIAIQIYYALQVINKQHKKKKVFQITNKS